VGQTLVEHPEGGDGRASPATWPTGRKSLQAGRAASLKRTHLELGGKAPVIVFDDADLERRGRRPAHLRLLQRRAGLHRGVPLYAGAKVYDSWSPTCRAR
jgi:aminobutyraldehyde dehydrogenase